MPTEWELAVLVFLAIRGSVAVGVSVGRTNFAIVGDPLSVLSAEMYFKNHGCELSVLDLVWLDISASILPIVGSSPAQSRSTALKTTTGMTTSVKHKLASRYSLKHVYAWDSPS